MSNISIDPKHQAITQYHTTLKQLHAQGVQAEGNLRRAFGQLLNQTASLRGWTLIEELTEKSKRGKNIRPDGVLRNGDQIPYGHWEAKDTSDNLEKEISAKLERGYDRFKNIIFEDTQHAVLFQDKHRITDADLRDPQDVALLLTRFYSYTNPDYDGFSEAVEGFLERIKLLGGRLATIIAAAHHDNPNFQAAFTQFFAVCQQALNPNISREAVDEMLIQHLLTERLMRNVLDNPDFTSRNVIAAEVEKVITALTSKSFSRKEFFSELQPFYDAIEATARNLPDFEERQVFLDRIYERFFQGYSIKVADTHGIVYTPHEIVDFMCAAVEEVLHDEFGLALSDPGVNILDPATGTGRFMLNLLRRIGAKNRRDLKRVYTEQLFANEVMLLPYYVAGLNIEHEYYEMTGEYEPFPGLVFADTLDMVKHQQMGMFAPKNTERMERERKAPITVIIGNPPYNMGQINENDNNKNRAYKQIDQRVRETYSADSRATNRNALADVYVKFFRWAADRLDERDGVVAFVTNNSFVDGLPFDGMRKHLCEDFTHIYHVDLHGNVRQNPKLSGTTHNVFGIQVGVGITIAIRSSQHTERKLFYTRVDEWWTKQEKLAWLAQHVELEGRHNSLNTVQWQELTPNESNMWLTLGTYAEYHSHFLIGSGEDKTSGDMSSEVVFLKYSRGLESTRDVWAYDFSARRLEQKISTTIAAYNAEVARYMGQGSPADIDNFIEYDDTKLKWSSSLKRQLSQQNFAQFDSSRIRRCLYSPFNALYVYFDDMLIHRPGMMPKFFPTVQSESENRIISCTNHSQIPFSCLMTSIVPEHAIGGRAGQCFPFYVYDEDGSNRRENITDWALEQFRAHYGDKNIDKWAIFYYVYGLLHHPGYRARYADNLKRELPRLPFAPDFWAFSEAGQKLADLHLHYEQSDEYPLQSEENPNAPLSFRVEKMRLNRDKSELVVNDFLTLKGIPAEAYDYRLGNRSALEWVIDQYRVKEDSRSGITSDPNRRDDPQYIVRLVGQVVRVSVETVALVSGLPGEFRPHP